MKKKAFLILTGVVLTFGLLVGCGNDEQSEYEQDVNQQPSEVEDVMQQPDMQVPGSEDVPSSSTGETEEPVDENTGAPTEQPTDSETDNPTEEAK